MKRLTAQVFSLMVFVTLFALAIGGAQGRTLQKQRKRVPAVTAFKIGGIKDESHQGECGCGFGPASKGKEYAEPLTIFAIDSDGVTGWVNIDGEDVSLHRRRAARGPKVARIGSRYTESFSAPGLNVFIVYIVTHLCIPYGPECETTGYKATITVSKAGQRQRIKAEGVCGCT